MRQEFLVENLVGFLRKKGQKFLGQEINKKNETKILKVLEEGIPTLFPPIMKTGLKRADRKANKNKFKNYIDKDELYDFDYLQCNKPGKTPTHKLKKYSEMLPTLLTLVITTIHPSIHEKLVKLTVRCFSQRTEFMQNIEKLFPVISDLEVQRFSEQIEYVIG